MVVERQKNLNDEVSKNNFLDSLSLLKTEINLNSSKQIMPKKIVKDDL